MLSEASSGSPHLAAPLQGRSLRLAFLMVALAAVAYGAYQPHWRSDSGHYPYPVHLDEYWHWGMATSVLRTGLSEAPDPFRGDSPSPSQEDGRYPTQIHERGYHAYLAGLQQAAGVDWLTLVEYIPVAISLLTALAAFALAERWGAGAETVLWMAAAPTTLRFLGPGFAVPISFALPLVLFGVFAVIEARRGGHWAVVMIVAAALWPVHAMGALLLATLVAIWLTATLRNGRALALMLAVALPFVLAWPHYVHDLQTSILREPGLPAGIENLRMVGPAVFVAAAIGTVWMATRRDVAVRTIGRAFSVVALLAMLVIFTRSSLGVDPLRLHDRAATLLIPLLAILAGAGSHALLDMAKRARGPRRSQVATATAAALLVVVAQLAAAGFALHVGEGQVYYRVLEDSNYAAYRSAASHDEIAGLTLVDGISTMAWTAITGTPTYHVQLPGSGPVPAELQAFLDRGAVDTAWMVERGITTLVTSREVANPDLVPIADGVYVLRDTIADRVVVPTG